MQPDQRVVDFMDALREWIVKEAANLGPAAYCEAEREAQVAENTVCEQVTALFATIDSKADKAIQVQDPNFEWDVR